MRVVGGCRTVYTDVEALVGKEFVPLTPEFDTALQEDLLQQCFARIRGLCITRIALRHQVVKRLLGCGTVAAAGFGLGLQV